MFPLRTAVASALTQVSLLLLSTPAPPTAAAFEVPANTFAADPTFRANRLCGRPGEDSVPITASASAAAATTKIQGGDGVAMLSGARTRTSLPSTADDGAGEAASPVRILALHGKGGSGPEFGVRLGPLVDALSDRLEGRGVVLDCLTAPFDLGGGGGEEMAWWTLPPGVRSFNAKEYLGFEESASVVTDALTTKDEGYDLVLGHSQGAILLSALLARGDVPPPRNEGVGEPKGRIFVLNGAAWPNPFSSSLSSFRWAGDGDNDDEGSPPRCLFMIGSSDGINPPEGARRVQEALSDAGLLVETIDHAGGHSVPVRDKEALTRLVDWMAKAVER
mmetsp:Transcript_52010/g.156091  ORF Transcript_52010/g.156091 Transcript_52010/m.156091 type:complete len:334 (-) Transcript_52010:382-1383(-)|eukprot:CAMPEP_0113556884 /NCGR_PEP_ID=MMETSP0015_2-20120614/17491_1 /TAXON_ID=2838 /ORGANISM="Odontella" /LENGTH=333 /DNA_ID=CAMNT_0000458263 /DNA_START=131 /DNA_END=1132 /DNA_ORIENTATION=+ /assembly_acc=CAM_ASM_000160